MTRQEERGAMTIGAAVVALAIGWASKDWTLGAGVFGAMLYAIPVLLK